MTEPRDEQRPDRARDGRPDGRRDTGSDRDPVHHHRDHRGEQPVADPPESSRTGRRRISRVLLFPLVIAATFFYGPAMGFVLGDRADQIDNRPLYEFPSIADGWKFIPELQAWANDHLPLRSQAVRVGTKISEKLFGEPPNYGNHSSGPIAGVGDEGTQPTQGGSGAIQYPRVLQGKDGWLYLGGDVSSACDDPPLTPEQSAQQLQKVSDAVKKSGRKFVVVIAPDKSAAKPEFLPDSYAGKACLAEKRQQFAAAAAKLTGVTLIDPSQQLVEAEKQGQVWRKLDTHWGPLGASLLGQDIARALDPALVAQTRYTVSGTTQLRGDLSALLGTPQTETLPAVQIDRPGVRLAANGTPLASFDTAPTVGYGFVRITGTATGSAQLYPGRTVLFGDSFLASSVSYVVPYFADLSYINYNAAAQPGAISTLAKQAVASDTVVLELVQRNAVSGDTALLLPQNADVLIKAMQDNPLR